MRGLLLATISLVFGLGLVLPSAAQVASDSQMADEALRPFARTHDEGVKQARILEFHADISDRARAAPDKVASATLVFATGISVHRLSEICGEMNVDVIRIELKIPLGDNGVVQSISIGPDNLLQPAGDFESRANRAIGIVRYQMMEMSRVLPQSEADQKEKMLKSEFRIYGAEVFGATKEFHRLTNIRDIRAVIADSGDSKIAAHNQIKKQFEERRKNMDVAQEKEQAKSFD